VFAGSFSLKRVLPALVPQMTYQGMALAAAGKAGTVAEAADAGKQRGN